ncbi:MAG TPA: DUF1622 domain-containing protein [Paracoccus sp.]|nr:DUF1622 domain-containing protein [Paracoccus sp. (in: a-proteobacteria)]
MNDSTRAVALDNHFPALGKGLEWAVTVIELFAVVILFIGLARFAWSYLRSELSGSDMVARTTSANLGRITLARYILMALEVFIVADILMAVVSASLQSLLFLALLVVIRSVISYFLEREMRHIQIQDDTV